MIPVVSLGALTLVMIGVEPSAARVEGAVPVRVEARDGQFRLVRDGKPYLVKGGGGDGSMELLAKLGGNCVRTWGVDEGLGERLDEAQRRGLTVCVGIWLGHPRHGFDYHDPVQVHRQAEEALAAVRRYKDHPAVLMWGLGNEMEEDGKDAAIWMAINSLATAVKKVDPAHPTMTVVAEIGGEKVRNLHRLCPEIDIVGINSYGGAVSVPRRYREAGGEKPYLLTEFGPRGRWEIEATPWGAPPEPTSTAKAEEYRAAYEAVVIGDPEKCMGSYAFIWGHKQEATATWFGILLADGSRLGAADTLSGLWSGKAVANRCPEIGSLTLRGADQVEPGARLTFALAARDPEGDPLKVDWVVRREVASYSQGGDREQAPPEFPKAVVKASNEGATVELPGQPGGYRVFAYVRDGHQGAAVANVAVLVKGKDSPSAPAATLPLVVYDEAGRPDPPYAPSGWMGNRGALKLDEACEDRPHGGKTCLRVSYDAPDQWAGIVWQSPPNDWGDLPGGHDLRGARRLSFWARGGAGGETVSVEFGIIGAEKPFPDSGRGKLADLRLSRDWQRFDLDLAGKDLSRIKSGFVIVLTGRGQAQTVDLDDIVYE